MWNDTDLPLGYLITFRCYGTWLHGDERGSIDRFHNRYKSPYLPRSDRRRELNITKLESDADTLNAEQRRSLNSAIREVCAHRSWFLHAFNVRTNHVHVVVSIGGDKPERALNAFKAYGLGECGRMETGESHTAPGLTEAASGVYGTSAAWRWQSTTSSMDKAGIYRTLTDGPLQSQHHREGWVRH